MCCEHHLPVPINFTEWRGVQQVCIFVLLEWPISAPQAMEKIHEFATKLGFTIEGSVALHPASNNNVESKGMAGRCFASSLIYDSPAK